MKMAADASAYGIGAVISHMLPDRMEKSIAFASRTLVFLELFVVVQIGKGPGEGTRWCLENFFFTYRTIYLKLPPSNLHVLSS